MKIRGTKACDNCGLNPAKTNVVIVESDHERTPVSICDECKDAELPADWKMEIVGPYIKRYVCPNCGAHADRGGHFCSIAAIHRQKQ